MWAKTLFNTRGFDSALHAARQYCVKLLAGQKKQSAKEENDKIQGKSDQVDLFFFLFRGISLSLIFLSVFHISLMHWSGKPQLCQRSKRMASTYVRNDTQFNHSDCRQRDLKFLHLTGCAFRAEIPLLSHDFLKRLSAIG